MTVTTLSSREFNQDTGRAKKAAAHGPVFITDRGKPSHVLLSFAEYERLLETQPSLVDRLAMPPEYDDVELDIPERRELPRAAEFD